MWWEKKWISEHTVAQELQVSLILFSLSSVCSLTERGGLLACWEICKDNEKSGHYGGFGYKEEGLVLGSTICCCPAITKWPLSITIHIIYTAKSYTSLALLLCVREGEQPTSKNDFRISADLAAAAKWMSTTGLTLLKHANGLFTTLMKM